MALTVCGLSAFGQGYVLWGGGPGSIWTWGPGGPTRGPAIYDVEFLWANGPGVTPLVDTVTGLTSTGTNSYLFYPYVAWSAILNDANFQFGVNFNGGTNVEATTGANGNFSYNSASTFPVTGLSSLGGIMTEYVIAWLAADGSTPQAAALVDSPVGWSAPFNYTYTSSIGTPLSIAASGFLPFGFLIPEPSTLALAGLGGLSLLLFRRRK